MTASDDGNKSLDTDLVTWTALLGHWVEFARSAMALPDDDVGRAMRESVSDIITLQAVYFSLREINRLPDEEKLLGLDRAEVLIDRAVTALRDRWKDDMPEKLVALIGDVRTQQQLAEAALRNDESETDAP